MELAGKTILVTGATGFIGSHLVRRLAMDEAARVRAFVRDPARAGTVFTSDLGVECCYGDITDRAAVERAVAGCDVIVHTAAQQSFAPVATRARFQQVNVGGTENLLRAFAKSGGSRFLHVSTINVHGLPPPREADAEAPLRYSGDPYSDSKVDGEQAAWQLAQSENIALTVIRPGCIFGPGSTAWTLQPLERLRRGIPILIGCGRGLCNYAYIDNLVDLMVAALKNDAAGGEAFIGCDGAVTWREFFRYYARMCGRPIRAVPLMLALLLGYTSALKESATGTPGPLSLSSVRFYSHPTYFDMSKNGRVLGHKPRVSLQEGMRRTEEWLRAQGIL